MQSSQKGNAQPGQQPGASSAAQSRPVTAQNRETTAQATGTQAASREPQQQQQTTATQAAQQTKAPTTNAAGADKAQQQQNANATAPEEEKGGPKNITKQMKEKAENAKAYIEGRYNKLKTNERERKEAWDMLESKMQHLNLSETEKELIKQDIMHKEAELNRKMRKKITVRDFEPLSIIGRGAFGEVRICRVKTTGDVVAMKKMKKSEMVYKNQVAHVKAEREVLVRAKNPWIVDLKFSFQDEKYLYLVMDFLPGGDLMTLLMRKDVLSEEESRFYIAETILAIETVHKVNYIHRDLKPDNILLDKHGHVKLTDFGLCKHAQIRSTRQLDVNTSALSTNFNQLKSVLDKKLGYRRCRKLAYSTVGTPDYIAPEVFGQAGYDETVDWWSVGVILFEMLVGYPPFFSDEPSVTCQKILHWKRTFAIPAEANLSPHATDILNKLIADPEVRLGRNGAEEIKAHPFFENFDFGSMRAQIAPYQPSVTSEISNENFDHFDEEDPFYHGEDRKNQKGSKTTASNRRIDMNFIGYTYKADVEEQRMQLVNVLKDLGNIDEDLQLDNPTHDESYPQHTQQHLSHQQQQQYLQQQQVLKQQQQQQQREQAASTRQQQVQPQAASSNVNYSNQQQQPQQQQPRTAHIKQPQTQPSQRPNAAMGPQSSNNNATQREAQIEAQSQQEAAAAASSNNEQQQQIVTEHTQQNNSSQPQSRGGTTNQQRTNPQSTLASTKQQMQQVKTVDSVNPSGKGTKRVNNIHLMVNETGGVESATSSTDHQQQRGVNNFMPTQAPQNSALYFQQAQMHQMGLNKNGVAKASPKNQQQIIQAPNIQNTSLETNESHQASGQVSATSNATNNRTTKYSPMRKPETGAHAVSAQAKQQHFSEYQQHQQVAGKNVHKVNYLVQQPAAHQAGSTSGKRQGGTTGQNTNATYQQQLLSQQQNASAYNQASSSGKMQQQALIQKISRNQER